MMVKEYFIFQDNVIIEQNRKENILELSNHTQTKERSAVKAEMVINKKGE